MTPSTKTEAAAVGLARFFTGQPCKRGHLSERYTSTGACVECLGVRQGGPQCVEDAFRAKFAAEQDAYQAKRADLKLALLDESSRSKRDGLKRELIEVELAYKQAVQKLRAEAQVQMAALRVAHELPAGNLPADTTEWRTALGDLKRATRRVENALFAFHKKSSLFATSASGSEAKRAGKGDGNQRLNLYEAVQLQVKYARKVAELDPNGTNWTRAFHEHHAATVQLAIERVLPWRIDEHGNMPPTREVEQSLERLRALRAAKVKAERIMRARMPDPVVFPVSLFDDVGEIRDVMQEGARFNLVMRFLDAEEARPAPPVPVVATPQLTEKPVDDLMEQIRAYQASRVPRMEPK